MGNKKRSARHSIMSNTPSFGPFGDLTIGTDVLQDIYGEEKEAPEEVQPNSITTTTTTAATTTATAGNAESKPQRSWGKIRQKHITEAPLKALSSHSSMADVVVAAVTLHQRQSIVTKTVRITKTTEDGKKRKRVNNYLILNHLGEGAFGKGNTQKHTTH
jgi:hypothetical protein